MSSTRRQGLNLVSKLNNIHVEDLQYVEMDLCYYELVSAVGSVSLPLIQRHFLCKYRYVYCYSLFICLINLCKKGILLLLFLFCILYFAFVLILYFVVVLIVSTGVLGLFIVWR